MGEIVLAFTPSKSMKDWQCCSDGDGNWFYEQFMYFYDTGCKKFSAYCPDHNRSVGHEPYYDISSHAVTEAPRIYISHHPKKGEWEKLKTVDDLRKSPLYVRD